MGARESCQREDRPPRPDRGLLSVRPERDARAAENQLNLPRLMPVRRDLVARRKDIDAPVEVSALDGGVAKMPSVLRFTLSTLPIAWRTPSVTIGVATCAMRTVDDSSASSRS